MGQKHYTLETWKEKATQVHNGKYNYARVTEYNPNLKCDIYCNICKEYFTQVLRNHLQGSGHIKCSASNSYWVNVQPLINKFKKVHGDTYDYSKFIYKGFHEKSIIICKKHGEFEQSPAKHSNNRGCPSCGKQRIIDKQSKTNNDIILEIEKLFPNKFKFDKLQYKNDREPIILYCTDCKKYHNYIPNYLLHSLNGCNYCYWGSKITTFEDFYTQLDKQTQEEYEYNKSTFKSSNTHIKIKHKKCGNIFEQTPNKHLALGRRCPYCAESGFKKDKDSILYYLEVNYNNQKFYKIGITNNTIKNRYFTRDLEKVTKQIEFPMIGQKAWNWEKAIIKEYKEHLYHGDEIILDSAKGNAELFTKDILGVFNGCRRTSSSFRIGIRY